MRTTKMCFLIVISVSLVLSCGAQNTIQDVLAAHNAARAAVGVGPMTWDPTLAAYAVKYANSRNGVCSPLVLSGGPYGENLAWGSSSDFSVVDAVKIWVDQKQYYDYDSNTCATGKVCDSYTQVVWRKSTTLGCTRTPCNGGGWYVICSYNPPGNLVGQWPY